MQVLQTERLTLSYLDCDDSEFLVELISGETFIRYIGDKGVRTVEDAHEYLRAGPLSSYETYGYGLFRTALTQDDTPIGICGLLKRDYLKDPDIGFALLPAYWSEGYACEAASAVLDWGRETHGLRRIVAIVSPENASSIALLEKLGMRFEHRLRIGDDEKDSSLYAIEFD